MTSGPVACLHDEVECLNHYELIRKYRCRQCGLVMMCSCERTIGETFLPHQLRVVGAATIRPLAVDGGFQDRVCRECRGLPPEAHPTAEIRGEASKLRRYYWREIGFKEMELFAAWATSEGLNPHHAYFDSRFKEQRHSLRKHGMGEIDGLLRVLGRTVSRAECHAACGDSFTTGRRDGQLIAYGPLLQLDGTLKGTAQLRIACCRDVLAC